MTNKLKNILKKISADPTEDNIPKSLPYVYDHDAAQRAADDHEVQIRSKFGPFSSTPKLTNDDLATIESALYDLYSSGDLKASHPVLDGMRRYDGVKNSNLDAIRDYGEHASPAFQRLSQNHPDIIKEMANPSYVYYDNLPFGGSIAVAGLGLSTYNQQQPLFYLDSEEVNSDPVLKATDTHLAKLKRDPYFATFKHDDWDTVSNALYDLYSSGELRGTYSGLNPLKRAMNLVSTVTSKDHNNAVLEEYAKDNPYLNDLWRRTAHGDNGLRVSSGIDIRRIVDPDYVDYNPRPSVPRQIFKKMFDYDPVQLVKRQITKLAK